MQDSQIPNKVPLAWAASAGGGYINAIPLPSQIPTNPGYASWTDGFVPLNFQPRSAGGIPPRGEDANGALNQISAGLQWLQAGGVYPYDATFQTTIGGYPNGAVVPSATTAGLYWRSVVDNNATNPDTGGAGWVRFAPGGFIARQRFTTSGTYTPTPGTRSAFIRLWAPGGGGGGSRNVGDAGVGGGGGEYREGLFTGISGTYAVTLPVGGGGGNASGSNGGTPASPTSIGGLLSCGTGFGGSGSNGAGIVTVTAGGGFGGSGGDVGYIGSYGGFGFLLPGSSLWSGQGGAAWQSPAPSPGISLGTAAGNGSSGIFPGAGGNGGVNGGTGGAGANGLCIIEEYG